MRWEKGSRYDQAEIGHLFAYIECVEAWHSPSDEDYEPEYFIWFVATDDELKNHCGSLASGETASRKEAEAAIGNVIDKLINALQDDLVALRSSAT